MASRKLEEADAELKDRGSLSGIDNGSLSNSPHPSPLRNKDEAERHPSECPPSSPSRESNRVYTRSDAEIDERKVMPVRPLKTDLKHKLSSSGDSEASSSSAKMRKFKKDIGTRNSETNSSESDNRSLIPVKDLPKETDLWTEEHLDLLGIHPCFKAFEHPAPMMTESIIRILGFEHYANYAHYKTQDQKYINMKECVSEALSNIQFDCECVEDVSLGDIEKMKSSFAEWWQSFLGNLKKEDNFMREYCIRVETQGQLFADQLEYMVLRQSRGEALLGGMYQQLLMHFMMMFNLPAIGFTNIDSKTCQIVNELVTSVPDILIMNTKPLTSPDVIAVVEVKRDYGRKEPFIPKPTRSRQAQANRGNVDIRHISSELIGQLGGDLLAHLPLSVFGDKGILGMIVQATTVSFTSLITQENYLQCLRNGHLEKKESTMLVSKECNILSKEGRSRLLEPLMELVFLYFLSQEKKMKTFL